MFILFTPFSFLFFSIYLLFMFSLLSISSFYYFWVLMEILALLFMGLSYTILSSNYSQLIIYFLIQAISSFLLLTFYIFGLHFLFTSAFLLKLSIFPFVMWYVNVAYRLPNFLLWFTGTVHNVPPMLILDVLAFSLDSSLLWISILMTTFISGTMILFIADFRLLLVVSSVGNNSWFLLSQAAGFEIFVLFLLIYSLSLFNILSNFNYLSNPLFYKSLHSSNYPLAFWVLTLSGLPPFPLFYTNFLIISGLYASAYVDPYFILFLLFNSFMIMGYLQAIINYFIYSYSSSLHYLLNY